jgi:hypothetical protein
MKAPWPSEEEATFFQEPNDMENLPMLRHTVELDEFATDTDMWWSSCSECSWRKPSCVDYKLERITSKRQLIFGSLWNIILSWNFEQLCLWGKGSRSTFRLFISMRSGCTLLVVLDRNNPEQKRNYWIIQIQCTEESVIEEQMNLPASVMSEIKCALYLPILYWSWNAQILKYNMMV